MKRSARRSGAPTASGLCSIAFGVVLLSACAVPPVGPLVDFEPGRPRAELVRVGHLVRFEPGSERAGPVERVRLDAFLRDMRLDRRDHVAVVAEAGPDAAARVAGARVADVTGFLAARGLAVEDTRMPFGASVPTGTVAVVVERAAVGMPDCGRFPGETAADRLNNLPMANFGCATARNLASMVADPRDLAAGRDPGPSDGKVAADAVRRYRAGRTKPLAGLGTVTSGPSEGG